MTQLQRATESLELCIDYVSKAERNEIDPFQATDQILKSKYIIKDAKIKKEIKLSYKAQLESLYCRARALEKLKSAETPS